MGSAILWVLSGFAIPPNYFALPAPELSGEPTLAPAGFICGAEPMGCIYMARNKANGKCYIGKTELVMEVRKRWHEREAVKGSRLPFYHALRKYGFDSFRWKVLMRDDDAKGLNEAEKVLIRLLGTKSPRGYNLTDGGEGMSGFHPSLATRRKLSKSHQGKGGWKWTEDARKRIGDMRRGKPLSEERRLHLRMIMAKIVCTPEYKEKQRQAQLGRKHSSETKLKIKRANLGRKFSVETRAKMSKSAKARGPRIQSEEERKRRSVSRIGKPLSEKIRGKIRESWERRRKQNA